MASNADYGSPPSGNCLAGLNMQHLVRSHSPASPNASSSLSPGTMTLSGVSGMPSGLMHSSLDSWLSAAAAGGSQGAAPLLGGLPGFMAHPSSVYPSYLLPPSSQQSHA